MKALGLAVAALGALAAGTVFARSRDAAPAPTIPDPVPVDPPADEVASYGFNAVPTRMPSLMSTSSAGLAHLRNREKCSLTRYRLGDGGYTIGWGRYYPDGGAVPPERIDQATADLWFAQDVQDKGERWVKAYVNLELTQSQFDALVSMAFNLKPASFRTIADSVNAGEGPEVAALKFVRAGSNLEAGLRNRRAEEFALYHSEDQA